MPFLPVVFLVLLVLKWTVLPLLSWWVVFTPVIILTILLVIFFVIPAVIIWRAK